MATDIYGRLFYLGSGFSAGAGVPLADPLLDAGMALMKEEVPHLHDRIQEYAEYLEESGTGPGYRAVTFERLCTFLEYVELREHAGGERWLPLGARELLCLRYCLAKVVAASTPRSNDIPELYLEFARLLTPADRVVTFNWDCLLENAISAVGASYSYMGSMPDIKIAKMHGSVNWVVRDNHASLDGWLPVDSDPDWPLYELMYHPDRASGEWGAWNPQGVHQPYLVLPGYGKAHTVRALAQYWYKPEERAAQFSPAYVIGLGLAEEDFFVRAMFLHTLRGPTEGAGDPLITVINPCPKARDTFAFALESPRVTLIPEPFCVKHLRLFERRQI